jgi:hypothetical protein
MDKDKSPIDSFAVSLGQTPSNAPPPQPRGIRPWNVLVCSDFGFASDKSRRVRIAEWNEFMTREGIAIAGTVENLLSPAAQPVFVEWNVASMKDLAGPGMKTKIAALSGYGAFLDALAGFLEGGATRDDALTALRGASLPDQENQRLLAMLGASGARPAARPTPASAKPQAAVASILSMVDIGGAQSGEAQTPHTAMDGLLRTISEGENASIDKASCSAYLESGKKKLAAQLAAIRARPFFASKKAALECLYQCARTIGRKKEIEVSVFSAAADDRGEVAEKLAADYESGGASWDIILWDYPVAMTSAEMDRVAGLLRLADRFKSVVIASLDPADRLFESIGEREDFSPVFHDIRFLPFKKLREALDGRALCLCAPDMNALTEGKAGDASADSYTAHCGWPLLIRWMEMTIDDLDPFAVGSRHTASAGLAPDRARFHPAIPEPVCDEAAAIAGLTLFGGSPADITIDRARTVIDPQVAGTAYSSLAFNLLVNRVARLAGERIIEIASSTGRDELCRSVEDLLRKELIACGICTEPDQVSVEPEGESGLLISLNSDVSVGGHAARFSFSLGG